MTLEGKYLSPWRPTEWETWVKGLEVRRRRNGTRQLRPQALALRTWRRTWVRASYNQILSRTVSASFGKPWDQTVRLLFLATDRLPTRSTPRRALERPAPRLRIRLDKCWQRSVSVHDYKLMDIKKDMNDA